MEHNRQKFIHLSLTIPRKNHKTTEGANEIYNNLCVGVSMKLREGAYRTIYNNIWVNGANLPCFHVANEDNYDRYFRNITELGQSTE